MGGVPLFDLETTSPWRSYCSRMSGRFANHNGSVFLIRPSARCALPKEIVSFSRGFMFYWLLGRLYKNVDLYGFHGKQHYASEHVGKGMYGFKSAVGEGSLIFEHLFYHIVAGYRACK